MATLQSLLSQRDAIDRKIAEQKSKRTMNEETIKLLDVKIKNLEAHKKNLELAGTRMDEKLDKLQKQRDEFSEQICNYKED